MKSNIGIDSFLEGLLYGQRKPKSDIKTPDRWTQAVKRETMNLPKVGNLYYVIVVFVLPKDKYPLALPGELKAHQS